MSSTLERSWRSRNETNEGGEMDERKGDDTYSRDWRTRLFWVKLKTRAWITKNMPAGVNFKSLRLCMEEERRR